MQRKKLEKLQTHLRTLKLFKMVNKGFGLSMKLPNSKDKTRFAMYTWKFDCGMPACVAGHASYIFNWNWFETWSDKFGRFFNLNEKETDWIIAPISYKNLNTTPETAAKHIQDVLDGKINGKTLDN